ncbi:hypothetical protein ACFVFS_33785 [Kitasatospora sp. NPDC057692]|uniref:hypothetical protein n=1 Tax=Kitasatospora sp. NPDC057692 TaxID=3346215 RepID=UPI00368E578C
MTSTTNDGPEPGSAVGGADGAAPGGWSAVVYGRTLRVDQWWRALPAGVDRQGPVGDAVRAAVAGGSRLEYGPRFLLHRDGRGVLVGAACELGLISREMVQDRFGRPLYGFVGWYRSAAAGPGGRLPGLGELAEHLVGWAGPVYTEWIAPTWEAVGREEAEPRTTRPVAAPWPDRPGGAADPAPKPPVWRPAHPAGSHLLPEADAPGLWAAAAAGPGRCVLVTGWRRRSDAEAGRLTHLTSADCHGYELLSPPPPPPPAPPQGGPGAAPEQGRGVKSGAKDGGKDGTKDGPATGPAPGPGRGPSGWGRTVRGLGKLGKVVVGALRPDDPEEQDRASGQHLGGRYPVTGQGPYGARDRDPYDGLGDPPPAPDASRSAGPGGAAPAPAPGVPRPSVPRPDADEPPRWRTRAVDPQEANLAGMFGEFDEDPAPPPPAVPAALPPPSPPTAPPAPTHPPKGASTDPADRPDPATGEPS